MRRTAFKPHQSSNLHTVRTHINQYSVHKVYIRTLISTQHHSTSSYHYVYVVLSNIGLTQSEVIGLYVFAG